MKQIYTGFTRVIGKGLDPKLIFSTFLLSLMSYFYVFSLGSFFSPLIYPLIDRVVYSTEFSDKYLLNFVLDNTILTIGLVLWILVVFRNRVKIPIVTALMLLLLIGILIESILIISVLGLISFPIIIVTIISLRRYNRERILFDKRLIVNYVAIIGIFLAAVSYVITLINLFYPSYNLPPLNHLYYIYLLLSASAPLLSLIIIGSLVALLFRRFIQHRRISRSGVKEDRNMLISIPEKSKTNKVALLIIIGMSICISAIPHLHTINPDNQLVGADSRDYSRLLESMTDNNSKFLISNEELLEQFNEDRPLSLLFYFFFMKGLSFIESSYAIDYLPFLLGPLLILSTYLLTREMISNTSIALVASFLTLVTFQILIGIYSGFYANWLSLVFGFLSLYYIFKILKKPTLLNLLVFSSLMIIVLLTHSSNWTVLLFVSIVFLTILFMAKKEKKRIIILLYLALIPSVLVDVCKLILINFSGIVGDISFAQDKVSLTSDLHNTWVVIVNTYNVHLAGIFGNSLVFLLVLYWLYHANFNNKSTILLVLFLMLPILPLLFAETEIQSRILYEIPYQIPAALGLYFLKMKYGSPIFICTCMWLLVISIRIVSNLHFNVLVT